MKNKPSIELYEDIKHYIYTEMSMYDDLSKQDKYKKDREIAKEKWKILNETWNEIEKILSRSSN